MYPMSLMSPGNGYIKTKNSPKIIPRTIPRFLGLNFPKSCPVLSNIKEIIIPPIRPNIISAITSTKANV